VDGDLFIALSRALEAERTVALATVLAGAARGRQVLFDRAGVVLAGDLGHPGLTLAARAELPALIPGFRSAKVQAAIDGQLTDLFVEVHGPRPLLVLVGAVHVAISLVHLARLLGWRTTVVDPRAVFATPERFAHADALIHDWPLNAFERVHFHDRSYLAVLSHDMKIDVPALAFALRLGLPYVGALGSKKTQNKRRQLLRDQGFSEEELAVIRAPIGLDLGGRRAEEIALAVIAEIVAVTEGGTAASPVAMPRVEADHRVSS
jgi:xanthine dehydrogenase accessory factor